MKLLMILWKPDPLNPKPFSPVQRALKFSAVLGTKFLKSSKVTLPYGVLLMETSNQTLGLLMC